MFLTNSQNWKESTRVFNTAYFSTRVNTSFRLSIYQVIFLNLKNLFSHCFSIFFYVIGIKINKKTPFIPTTPLIIFNWIFRTPKNFPKIRTRKNSVFGHISHSVPPLPLCADYMQYICKIGTSLHPFPCTMNTTSRCLILWHKHSDSTKQFFSFGDTKSDHNRQKRHNELRYVTMKCDKAQWKLDF